MRMTARDGNARAARERRVARAARVGDDGARAWEVEAKRLVRGVSRARKRVDQRLTHRVRFRRTSQEG